MSSVDYPRVQPGDLIRADYFNDFVDALGALEARVATLEQGAAAAVGAGQVIITSLSPASPRVGEEMTIEGRNFGFSVGAANVRFDSTRVTSFKSGSNNSRLVFDVPAIPGIDDESRPVRLTVENQTTSTSRMITVQPREETLQGNFDIQFDSASAIAPGNPATFRFSIESRANLPLTLTVTPTITLAGVDSSDLDVLRGDETPLPDSRLSLPALQERDVVIRLPEVPAGSDGDDFTLSVSAEGQGLAKSSGPQPFTVGEAPENPDEGIELGIGSVNPASAFDGATSTLTLSEDETAELAVLVDFERAGDFEVAVTAPDGWTLDPPFTGPQSFEIEAVDIGSDGFAHRSIELAITAGADAEGGTLEFVAREEGATQMRRLPLQLQPGS